MAFYIGIMSGTSLDGIDVALIEKSPSHVGISLIAAETMPFPAKLLRQVKHFIAYPDNVNLIDLGALSVELGHLFANAVQQLLNSHSISADQIKAIGSHGQTVFHAPNHNFPFSMQLGDPSEIAQRTGITTIADFRQRDIAAGGQGAPLVPAFHQALFHSDDEQRIIVNIGGISNITVLPRDSDRAVMGFDTGPGNGLLDAWYQQHQVGNYDANGKWAASGKINVPLLDDMLSEPYFSQLAPKSTGKEYFNAAWLAVYLDRHSPISNEDIQATLTALTAHTIANSIQAYPSDDTAIYICGGGAHNSYLLQQLQTALATYPVKTTDALGLSPDWVEACAFAWLAERTLANQPGNLTSVTGASQPVILGGIYPA